MNRADEQMRELIASQALGWFMAHRAGPLPESQRLEFLAWLRASPAHAAEYIALTGVVGDVARATSAIRTPAATLIAQARADVDRVSPLFTASRVTPPAQTRQTRFGLRWTAIAALALAFIVATASGGYWLYSHDRYVTAHAEQRSWRMPDGSTVHLNSDSRIRVRFTDARREVDLLRGQALFQVAKNPHRPFIVHAGGAVAQALGTEFDVYRQGDRTLISVMEGRVAVWRASDAIEPREADKLAQLDAGQQVRVSRNDAVVSNQVEEVRKTVAWLQRQVMFDHDPLGRAVEEFNRYSERRIRIEDPRLRQMEISGVFSAYDAESFIRFLERQPHMRVRSTDEEIVVEANR